MYLHRTDHCCLQPHNNKYLVKGGPGIQLGPLLLQNNPQKYFRLWGMFFKILPLILWWDEEQVNGRVGEEIFI